MNDRNGSRDARALVQRAFDALVNEFNARKRARRITPAPPPAAAPPAADDREKNA